jgi:tRNA1Val (adenine37-N6)-methyltransferase
MKSTFQFKQFSIQQDRCAMKVGTDGVLLGAWTRVDQHPETVLDIGAGTGLISLMIAQRHPHSFIEALEIDEQAFEQCVENFEASPWGDRLFCYHASLLEFAEDIDEQYDFIVCNPPFYESHYKTAAAARNLARFQDAMPFDHLIYAATKLLSAHGIFSVIIPFTAFQQFVELAQSGELHLNRYCKVQGHPEASPKRVLLEFSFQKSRVLEDSIIIETARHQYTKAYTDLTRDFYLKM